jgi:hypothetical protein
MQQGGALMLGATDVDSTSYARAGNGIVQRVEPGDDDRDRDARTGRFLPGNRAWESRSSSAGPKPRFAHDESLWAACVKYFDWVDDNPLYEMHLITFEGRTTQEPVAKMRAMSKTDLCTFLNIERSTWNNWKRNRPDLALTIEHVESVIFSWNFGGAAAGLLDAGIVARQLGLARKTEGGSLRTESKSSSSQMISKTPE